MSNSINPIQTLKGFRDFLPTEAKKRQWLIQKIKTVCERFGFEPLETPALEYESLLLGKYGAEADKLIYGFEDKGGRRVALRYDQTVPTARVIAQYRNELVFPYRRFQIQPVWRSEKPQKGRYREFLQVDADIIGVDSRLADAEILVLFASIYKAIGLNSIKIKINDRKQLVETVQKAGVPQDQIFTAIQTLDKLEKLPLEKLMEEFESKGIDTSRAQNLLDEVRKSTLPASLEETLNLVQNLGISKDVFEFSPTLARGLDYYTGLIFEGAIPEYLVGSVGGGGRYDNLIKDLVGYDSPAVGFGLGFDRTLEAVESLGKLPKFISSAKVLVTIFSPELTDISLQVTGQLRENGIAAECYSDPQKKLDVQLKYADKRGIPYAVIIGPEEKDKGMVKLKNMKTGEQNALTAEQLIATLK